jgi:hypothetical protein
MSLTRQEAQALKSAFAEATAGDKEIDRWSIGYAQYGQGFTVGVHAKRWELSEGKIENLRGMAVNVIGRPLEKEELKSWVP